MKSHIQRRIHQDRQRADRRDRARARDAPLPQQDAEASPRTDPAVTNKRSPPTPWLPMVVSDSEPNTISPATMVAPPRMRCAGRPFAQDERRQDQPDQRRAGRLDGGAVTERHQHEAEYRRCIACGGPDSTLITRPRPQPMPPRSRNAVAQHERHQQQAGPEEAVKGEIGRRKADVDAVLGGDKAGRPAERRAGAAKAPIRKRRTAQLGGLMALGPRRRVASGR